MRGRRTEISLRRKIESGSIGRIFETRENSEYPVFLPLFSPYGRRSHFLSPVNDAIRAPRHSVERVTSVPSFSFSVSTFFTVFLLSTYSSKIFHLRSVLLRASRDPTNRPRVIISVFVLREHKKFSCNTIPRRSLWSSFNLHYQVTAAGNLLQTSRRNALHNFHLALFFLCPVSLSLPLLCLDRCSNNCFSTLLAFVLRM